MKKKYTFLLFFILAFALKAQESVIFKMQFLAGKKYELRTISNSNFTMNFEAKKEVLDAIKKQITLPMISKTNMEIVADINTGKEIENKIPFVIDYKKVHTLQNIGGKEMNPTNPIEGSRLFGYYENGLHMKIDSIKSKIMDEKTKEYLIKTVQNITNNIKFPDYALKVGDTFKQKIPMKIPIEGIGNISLILDTNYKLMEIKNNIAYFDTIINFTLGSDIPQFTVTSTGNGTGKVEYNILNTITQKNITNYNLLLNVANKDFKIKANIDAESSYNLKILN